MADEKKTDLTPEELEEAVALWKARRDADSEPDAANTDSGDAPSADVSVTDSDDAPESPPDGIESKLASVRDRRDRRDADGAPEDMDGAKRIISQQNDDLDTLTACLETLLAEKDANKADCDDVNADGGALPGQDCDDVKGDGSDDESRSLNADSADDIIRQRLSICRVGDKLHLDGLEDKSIMDGKKAIISKVLPNLRLDGKSKSYVDACYDIAVSKLNARKDADYQRRQMAGGRVPANRNDSNNGVSMASAARQRMLEREGGND